MTRITLVCATAIILLSPVSFAGEVTGTVSTLMVRQSDGLTYFYMSGAPTGKPACASNSYWMIKDENSEAGKKIYSLLLAAKISQTPIKVVGANTCTRWVDGEDVETVFLQ